MEAICHTASRQAAALLLLSATGGLFAAQATALPEAFTSIEVRCDGSGELSHQHDGDSSTAPSGQSGSCDVRAEGYNQGLYYYRYEGAGDALAALGPAVPRVGSVAVSGSAFNASRFGGTSVLASAGVVFYFAIEKFGDAPFEPPTFPIYFEARGAGSLTRIGDENPPGVGGGVFGNYLAIVQAMGVDFRIEGGAVGSDSFSRYTTLALAPNDPLSNPFYRVVVSAACSVDANGWVPELPQQGECSATADPEIRFDQEAFDAAHGADSYRLADYYAVRFSENVPEPGTASMLGLGILGVVHLARRRIARATRCAARRDPARSAL